MLTIGVVSDTHIPAQARSIPDPVKSAFSEVDLILHAGDLTCMEVLDELSALAPVKAVCGNMDDPDVCETLAARRVVEVEGCRIGLMHGSGPPFGLHRRVVRSFRKEGVQVVVFGHSHRPHNEQRPDVLLFNPGSPTDARFAPCRSFGKLLVEQGKVAAQIVKINGCV
jgi:putative phosphoesterase